MHISQLKVCVDREEFRSYATASQVHNTVVLVLIEMSFMHMCA